uniref:Leucine Rich Repeat family protein n=1 Tax=Loa loa TaxID=7209 RepID=A0A1I7V8D7_LOALO
MKRIKLIIILHTIALLLVSISSILGLCPQNCTCDNEYQLAANCNNVKLRYLPSLLHPGIQSLRLSKCQIEQLDVDIMELYPDIIHLDLSSNHISMLANNVFRYQGKTEILNLSNNNFPVVFRNSFRGLHRLQSLDLSSGKLQTIEWNALKHMPELLELDLSYNILQNLSFATFIGLKKLEKLIVAGNQITYLNDGPLSRILPNLRTIDLSKNMITTLKKIESHNFRQLQSLLELDLTDNEFSILPALSFDGLFRLKQLKLSEQQYLREIQSGAFFGLASLEVLNLSYSNLLEYIDENAFEVSHALRIFNVRFCALKTFPPTLLDWKRVAELHLYGNPFHCDYKLLTFLPDVLRLRSIHDVICATPDELRNISISSLDTVEVTLEDVKQTLIILCSTLTFLTAIIILILFSYSRITLINDQIRKSKSSTVNQQFGPNSQCSKECIFPEYYNSITEFNCRRENTFVNLPQSKSLYDFYDKISTQIPITEIIVTNEQIIPVEKFPETFSVEKLLNSKNIVYRFEVFFNDQQEQSEKRQLNGLEALLNDPGPLLNSPEALLNNPEALLSDPEALLNGSEALLNGSEALLNGSEALLNGSEALLRSNTKICFQILDYFMAPVFNF